MAEIEVYVGLVETMNGGTVQDTRKKVIFEGEKLGCYREYGQKEGHLTSARGTTETLYDAADGRLVVLVDNWSNWEGEPSTETLVEVKPGDLEPGGRFYALACACGLGRPLTLEEALDGVETVEPEEWEDPAG